MKRIDQLHDEEEDQEHFIQKQQNRRVSYAWNDQDTHVSETSLNVVDDDRDETKHENHVYHNRKEKEVSSLSVLNNTVYNDTAKVYTSIDATGLNPNQYVQHNNSDNKDVILQKLKDALQPSQYYDESNLQYHHYHSYENGYNNEFYNHNHNQNFHHQQRKQELATQLQMLSSSSSSSSSITKKSKQKKQSHNNQIMKHRKEESLWYLQEKLSSSKSENILLSSSNKLLNKTEYSSTSNKTILAAPSSLSHHHHSKHKSSSNPISESDIQKKTSKQYSFSLLSSSSGSNEKVHSITSKNYPQLAEIHKQTEIYRYSFVKSTTASGNQAESQNKDADPISISSVNDYNYDALQPRVCVICRKEKPITMIFFPCEHSCVCEDCRRLHSIGMRTRHQNRHHPQHQTTNEANSKNNDVIVVENPLLCPICNDEIKLTLRFSHDARERYWSWVHEVRPYLDPSFSKYFHRRSRKSIRRRISEQNDNNNHVMSAGSTIDTTCSCIIS